MILNKSSTYAEFAELFVKHSLKGHKRVEIIANCYKTKSIKSSEQLSITRGQSVKIHIESRLSKVLSVFHNSILRNSDNKKRVIELIFEYNEREAKHYLELFGISEIILSSKNKYILVMQLNDVIFYILKHLNKNLIRNLFYMLMKY